MPAQRISMTIIKNLLQLRHEEQLSYRQIARRLKISVGTVSLHLNRAQALGLTWPLPEDLDECALEQRMYPNQVPTTRSGKVEPDYAEMHRELKRKGVTKQLLWEEYKQRCGDNGYQYSQYCQRYQDWAAKLTVSMRQNHKAGEKVFVDYCGPTVDVINPATGDIQKAQIFVMAWGASNYTYVEAQRSQGLSDWIEGHVNGFDYFGGVPALLVPDNLKSAVTVSSRYEPEINRSYQHMANHYKTAILPARPKKPKDKAKVENAVLVTERWVLARLRHVQFFSFFDLNQHIRKLVEDLNTRPFKKLPGCRRSQFDLLDRPAMRALPASRYEYTEFKLARVNIDYHIEFDKHFYSVPHHFIKYQVDVQATRDSVRIFFKGRQIAHHPRNHQAGRFTTHSSHMPENHRFVQEWTPGRLLNWAQELGPNVLSFTKEMILSKPHPEQAYRACLGLLNLSKKFDVDRLDRACLRARQIGSLSLKSVKSILANGLDQTTLPIEHDEDPSSQPEHENIRGPEYYH